LHGGHRIATGEVADMHPPHERLDFKHHKGLN
jgi:hypothetical protein